MIRINTHDAAACGIHSGKVLSHDKHPGLFRRAHDRAVSFHSSDAINDGKVRFECGVDVKNRLRYAFLV